MARAAATLDVFHAVADPTRRRMLDLLAEKDRAVMDFVGSFPISQPAISQHLRVLRAVGLVRSRKSGRQRIYSLNPEQLMQVAHWISLYERFWDERLQRLHRHLAHSRETSKEPTS